MDRSKRKLFLLCVCLLVILAGYGISSHRSSKTKASKEMQTGMKAASNPEALVKDLLDE
jgi:hypothetical protein